MSVMKGENVTHALKNILSNKKLHFFYRMGGNYHLAEELTQETFYQVAVSLDGFRGNLPFPPGYFASLFTFIQDTCAVIVKSVPWTGMFPIPTGLETRPADYYRPDFRLRAGKFWRKGPVLEHLRRVLVKGYISLFA